LAGDGVYNLLGETINALKIFEILPREKIVVSKEDLEARGVLAEDNTIVTTYFYERLVEDMMKENNRIFVF
jgi:sulfur relay protein TusB/DsrH